MSDGVEMTQELANAVAGDSLDFSTICIYTCQGSCGVDSSKGLAPLSREWLEYRDEMVWVQKDLNVHLCSEAMKLV